MAISDTINSMKEHVQSAYSQIESMNGTIPTKKNLENLAGAIGTIKTGTDTSDATATADDILFGKTAYAKGKKLTGTIETYAGDGSETVNKLASLVDGSLTEITADDLDGATKIADYAFSHLAITSIDIPYSVKSISQQAFANCYSLLSVTIPNSVTKIRSGAFYYCYNLPSIVIPYSVTEIGQSAFNQCRALKSVNIPIGVTIIDSYVFNDCSALTSITIHNSVTRIGSQSLYIGTTTNKATITMLPTTPPTIQSNTFNKSYLQKIIVPTGTGATYKAATNWSTFADYIEEAAE